MSTYSFTIPDNLQVIEDSIRLRQTLENYHYKLKTELNKLSKNDPNDPEIETINKQIAETKQMIKNIDVNIKFLQSIIRKKVNGKTLELILKKLKRNSNY